MYAILQQVFPVVFGISWIGITAFLLTRFRAKQREYYRKFPPVGGIPLDAPIAIKVFSREVQREGERVLFRRQADPELEQLRRETLGRYGLMVLWIFAYPLLTFGVIALLSVSGLIHHR